MSQLIGKIRHRVALHAPQFIEDGAGGQVKSWQQVATLWAFLQPKSGRENFRETIRSEQLQSSVVYEIIIRYRDDVNAEMRFTFGNRKFNILSAFDKQGHKQWLTCICEEIKA